MAEAMGKTVRWGILGAGIIASKMADALSQDNDSTLVAVASKSAERAKRFAAEYAVPKALSYEQLAANPDIDIVYIATTHNYHYENAKMILERGKPVLMEKAFTINADQAAGLINLARRKGLFLMEAHWVRFLPSLIRLRQILAAGTIGEVLQEIGRAHV